jgi:hypothetical protein
MSAFGGKADIEAKLLHPRRGAADLPPISPSCRSCCASDVISRQCFWLLEGFVPLETLFGDELSV